MRRGKICFYINKGCRTDVTVLSKSCSPHLETLFINCKPFHSLQEFSSFISVSVYIPPRACVTEALQHMPDHTNDVQKKHSDFLLIVLRDFNRPNLIHERYKQHVKCPIRDTDTPPLLQNFKGCLALCHPCSLGTI